MQGLVRRTAFFAIILMLAVSPASALDEDSRLSGWVKSTPAVQLQLAGKIAKQFLDSGGFDKAKESDKTVRERNTKELSEYIVKCINEANQLPPDDPALDEGISVGNYLEICIETSLYN
jgi:hypothetical protein